MTQITQRINAPASDTELERRWSLIRAAMKEAGIDVLLLQNNSDWMGGYVKYFTDLPATNGYPVTVLFPVDEPMTVFTQGPFGGDRQFPGSGDEMRRGVGRLLTVPSYVSAAYTLVNDVKLVGEALKPYARATLGLVGPGTISYSLMDGLRQQGAMPAHIIDASDLVDQIKVPKSAEELMMIRRTAALQDEVMKAAFDAIRPGMRDREVAAVAEKAALDGGSEQGIFLCCSFPIGQPVLFANRHLQDRVIEAGDCFHLLAETNGPGGQYTELGRTCVLGRADDHMKEEFALVLEARQFTLSMLRSGASCEDVWNDYNVFLRKHGRPEENRLFCHGQGYDMVERPLVRFDEPMRLQANLNLVCHPTYLTQRTLAWACDNYFMHESGELERLHSFPEVIVEL